MSPRLRASHWRNCAQRSAPVIVKRATGFRRNGMSVERSRSPRGSIHMPKPGRIEKIPPSINRVPVGMRAHRDAGCRSHLSPPPIHSGTSRSKRRKACRSDCFPVSIGATPKHSVWLGIGDEPVSFGLLLATNSDSGRSRGLCDRKRERAEADHHSIDRSRGLGSSVASASSPCDL